jgi:hypothetical protein
MLRNGTILKAKSSFILHLLVLRVFDKIFKRKRIVNLTPQIVLSDHSKVYESLPRHNMKLPSFCFHPTSIRPMWSLGRDKHDSILALHVL